jgi:hypothetical protein
MHSLIAERLRAQLLTGPAARDPVRVVERILAVQAQDPRGARLAIRARTKGLVAADVDRALTEDRSLVITWLNRGTLHLVRAEDYPWLHALTASRLLTATLRRLSEEGVSPTRADRAIDVIGRSLADEGPLVRDQLAERVAAARVPVEGQALLHLLVLASIRGVAVRGPMVGKQHAYALVRDWVGPPEPVDRDAALAELAVRYLAGHAPADDRDLAYWTGLPLRDARAGLAAAAGRRRSSARRAEPPTRLLGPYDPVLHGWRSREPLLGRHDSAVVTGGIFRPFALVEGEPVGTWRLAKGRVELAPFEPLDPGAAAALANEAAHVERFLA